jgi:hypothetical protein
MYDGVCLITDVRAPVIQMMQIPANYYFSPWWVLGLMLFGMFIVGMIYGMGAVIGWKEFVQKIRILIFNLRMKLEQ